MLYTVVLSCYSKAVKDLEIIGLQHHKIAGIKPEENVYYILFLSPLGYFVITVYTFVFWFLISTDVLQVL